MDIVYKFSEAYKLTITGVYGMYTCTVDVETRGKTKIFEVIHLNLKRDLYAVQPTFEALLEDKHFEAYANITNSRPKVFNDPAFDPPFEAVERANRKIKVILLKLRRCNM